jgi:hypothetical protein
VARIKARRGRDATKPLDANIHHQPAHGDSRISVIETADWHGESPHFQCGEDVKRGFS